MKYLLIGILALFMSIGIDSLLSTPSAEASRSDDCACRELQTIRRILEAQYNLVCNAARCVPAPTPTSPDGGPLE